LNGKKSNDPEGFAQAEVLDKKSAALQGLRSSSWVYAEIPDVQGLLSQVCERGTDSWSDEIELVGRGI